MIKKYIKYDWIAFYDFDEFLTLVEDKNIKEYLSRDCFKNANQILINWKTYTDNDLICDDGRPCLERFTKTIFLQDECLVKFIIKSNLTNLEMYCHHMIHNIL